MNFLTDIEDVINGLYELKNKKFTDNEIVIIDKAISLLNFLSSERPFYEESEFE